MAVWGDLPSELITMILSHLTVEGQHACLTVSSFMRALVEPLLYRDLVLFGRRTWQMEWVDHVKRFASLHRLVRTLITRPALGAHVKCLAVRYEEFDPDAMMLPVDLNATMTAVERAEALENIPSRFDTRSDCDIMAAAAEAKGLSAGLILRGGWGGQIVLLLHYLTRLQSVYFSASNAVRPVADAALGRLKGGVPIGLLVVQRLQVGLDSLDGSVDKERDIYEDLQTYVPFMALPSLVDFKLGDGVGMPVGKLPFYTEIEDGDEADSNILGIKLPVARDTSAIRSLSLVYRSIDTRILQRILALPHRLETFSYSVDYGLTPFVPKSIAQGLSPHAHSLTVLTLRESSWTSKNVGSVLGSLKQFQVLHTLSVSVTALLGHSTTHSCSPTEMALTNPLDALLPCSLVTLNLKLWDRWKVCDLLVVTGLPYTMKKTRVTMSSLKTFTIDRKGTKYWVDEAELSDIKQAMDMIPDLLFLLKSNEITVSPPLVAAESTK